ncbi:MAG: DUF427 domain-containing protein [Alphaproteobacteria bacterium]|nr:DUF427 domain-containing protein [Alphaproteobacteria bacterium]
MTNSAPGYAKKPEHRVDLLPESKHIRVTFGGTVIADTKAAIRCEETGHGPVYYLPEKDVRMELLHATDHKTYCPFKGDCSYWTIDVGGNKQAENAVWGYRAPYDEALGLTGHYAFYPNRVDAIEVS